MKNNLRLITNNIPRDKHIVLVCNDETEAEALSNIYQLDNITIINIDNDSKFMIEKCVETFFFYRLFKRIFVVHENYSFMV